MSTIRVVILVACALLAFAVDTRAQIYEYGDHVDAGRFSIEEDAAGFLFVRKILDNGDTEDFHVVQQGDDLVVKDLYGKGNDVTFVGILDNANLQGSTTDKHGYLGKWARNEYDSRCACRRPQFSPTVPA